MSKTNCLESCTNRNSPIVFRRTFDLANVEQGEVPFCQTYQEFTQDVVWSTYIPQDLRKFILYLINEKLIDRSEYMICPIYTDKNTGLKDVQIGVTGTAFHGETAMETMVREVAEELGFLYKKDQPTTEKLYEPDTRGKRWTYFHTQLRDHSPNICQYEYKSNDNRKKKIAAIIVGSMRDVMEMFCNPVILSKNYEADNIHEIVAVPVSKILDILYIKDGVKC